MKEKQSAERIIKNMMGKPEVTQKTDNELVLLALENQDYFLPLVNRYEKKLLFFILRISNVSKEEAEDLLQEIFIKIYKNLNDFDPELKFSSWAYRIARNHVISHHRKKKNQPPPLSLEVEQDIIDNLSSDLDIREELDQQFLSQQVSRTLNVMSDKYKEVLILRYFEDKDYQEISDILRKPRGTVATLINRAKKQFKENFNNNLI